jgi:lysophospholipid acyltransferase
MSTILHKKHHIHISYSHIGRQIKGFEGDTELDYSGAMMIITIKLSSYGFNVLDGQLTNQKSSHAQQMKIEHYPTLLQYFGWVFFFAGFLAGPTCEYMDYLRFVESPPSVRINTWSPALKRCGKSFIFIACLVYLAPTYNYFEALKPAWQSKTFMEK